MEKTAKGKKAGSKKSARVSSPFNFKVSHPADGDFMAKRIGIAMAMFKPEKGITNPVKSPNGEEKTFGIAQSDPFSGKTRVLK